MTSKAALKPQYGGQVAKVEPFGVQVITTRERHGSPRSQFTLWLGSNLTIADFALGFLPISLGLSWVWSIAAIIIGNILGSAVVAACAAMGPTYGSPQLMIGRYSFGRIGGYLPGLLNYISTIGWFTVNNILGTFGLKVLFPGLAFWQGAVLLVIVQGLIAVYGHNLIHAYERIMSVVLGIVFLVCTIIAITHASGLTSYHSHLKSPWAMFAIMVAAAFSYIGSWGTYASDYSRYLNPSVSRSSVFGYAFFGSVIPAIWLELVGMAVGVLAGKAAANPIVALHQVMGGFGLIAVIAIILGGTAADALNLYSNSLSAGALDIRLPRPAMAVVASLIGLALSLWGAGAFEQKFDNFLLLLGYWITPWLAILFVDFYVFKRYRIVEQDRRNQKPVQWAGLISFIIGIAASVPFMSSTLYPGPIANRLGGADLSFYVGFIVAGVCYWLSGRSRRSAA